jgi:hypothetical protein
MTAAVNAAPITARRSDCEATTVYSASSGPNRLKLGM